MFLALVIRISSKWIGNRRKTSSDSTYAPAPVAATIEPPLEPPTVKWLLQHRDQNKAQTIGDTPLASLYRMFEFIVTANTIGLRNEIESFFNHPSWAVSAIPDPNDADPARYAILSVIPHFLMMAFNRLIERGLPRGSPAILSDEDSEEMQSQQVVLEELPPWTARVAKLSETLVIPDVNNETPPEEDRSRHFLNMNIISAEPHVLFI